MTIEMLSKRAKVIETLIEVICESEKLRNAIAELVLVSDKEDDTDFVRFFTGNRVLFHDIHSIFTSERGKMIGNFDKLFESVDCDMGMED